MGLTWTDPKIARRSVRVRRLADPRVVPGVHLYDLTPTALAALGRVTSKTRDLLAGKQQVTGLDNRRD